MSNTSVEANKALLKEAWDQLIQDLQDARDTIDHPEFFPPEADNRTLAEGYRYLSGFIHHAIERAFHEDPSFPSFRNALSIFNKSTIENADAVYFYAPIDGRQRYIIRAQLHDSSHWRGEPRKTGQPVAPHYMIFETFAGPMSGDTGSLAELMPGTRVGFGSLDSSSLQVDANGMMELLLAPEKPAGYQGNFICTRKPPGKDNPEAGDRYASCISGRQLFYDWEHEAPAHFSIVALDHAGDHPPALSAEQAAGSLRKLGGITRGHMRFWLAFYDKVLNVKGNHGAPEDGRYFFPTNGFNRPNAASNETAGGMGTNIYAGGLFNLEPDEALYIEARYHGEPNYTSFHLGNLWGESTDYANHQSSLNFLQMYMGDDGVQRWVVAHDDPGIQNWLDTTGLKQGFLTCRWAYSTLPPEDQWPEISAKKIPFAGIANVIPVDMPKVSTEQRREQIAIRQQHVQRRYRVF